MSLLDEEVENALDWLQFWRDDLVEHPPNPDSDRDTAVRVGIIRRVEFSEDEALRALWARIEAAR